MGGENGRKCQKLLSDDSVRFICLTAEGKDGRVAASTVNWVTQTAFEPPGCCRCQPTRAYSVIRIQSRA
jgi:flavin reductase (DIM6/NTAB) family NADH-FMN oxidoreductase RutF